MKIEFSLPDLLKALEVVSIVTPRPVTASGAAGYLFVVRGQECFLYSRDELCVARASFPLSESSEDGQFVYPAESIDALKYLDDDSCTIEASSVDERFTVRYQTASGVEAERSSFDPQLLSTFDEDLEAAAASSVEFRSGVLREAINLAKPFIGKVGDSKVGEHFKGLQIMDATRVDKDKGIDYSKGDGYLFVSDGTRTFFFQCDDFKGKSLEIHAQFLGLFVSFLSKCKEKVVIRKGSHLIFAMSESGQVLGWPLHTKLHDKFVYYTLKTDNKHVFQVNRARFVNSLQHARMELPAKQNKVKLNFSQERKSIWIGIAEGSSKAKGIPVEVKVISDADPSEVTDFSLGINLDFLIELVNSVKGHTVEFRCGIFPASETRKRDMGLFRTIDDFRLDPSGKVTPESEGSFQCKVTRFMPSKD